MKTAINIPCPECDGDIDVDITEFKDEVVLADALRIIKYFKKFGSYEEQIDQIAEAVQPEYTIRDVQYIEVFAQLKEKFTVLELEALLATNKNSNA